MTNLRRLVTAAVSILSLTLAAWSVTPPVTLATTFVNNLPVGSLSGQLALNVAVDGAGNVFYSNSATGAAIWELNRSTGANTLCASVGTGRGAGGGLALDAQGDLFVSDGFHDIYRVPAGCGAPVVFESWSSPTTNVGPLAADAAGNLYVILDSGGSSQVLEYFATGGVPVPSSSPHLLAGGGSSPVTASGQSAVNAELSILSLAISPSGGLYIGDSLSGTVLEWVGGSLVVVAGQPGTHGQSSGSNPTQTDLDDPSGLAFDSAGDLFIANITSSQGVAPSQLNELTSAGNYTEFDLGTFTPSHLAFSPDGTLYLAGFPSPNTSAILAYTATPAFPALAVGSSSNPQTLTVSLNAPTQTDRISIHGSFAMGTITGCSANGSSANLAGTTCTIPVSFNPSVPGVNRGYLEVDSTIVATTTKYFFPLSAVGLGPLVQPMNRVTTQVALSGLPAGNPTAFARDAFGNNFLAVGNTIYTWQDGAASAGLYAGGGAGTYTGSGTGGDGGPATSAALATPQALATDAAGDLFISNSKGTVREVAASTGIITTYVSGFVSPIGLAVGPMGNLFILDQGLSLYEVSASTATKQTLFTGSSAPWPGLATDAAGNVYYFSASKQVMEYSPVTRASTALANAAGFSHPTALWVDPSGRVYVADNGAGTISQYDPSSQTLAPLGSAITDPYGLAGAANGSLLVTTTQDTAYSLAPASAFPAFGAEPSTVASPPQQLELINTGNASAQFSSFAFPSPSDFTYQSASTLPCAASTPLTSTASCNLQAVFTPSTTDPLGAVTGSLTVSGSNFSSLGYSVQGTVIPGPPARLAFSTAPVSPLYAAQLGSVAVQVEDAEGHFITSGAGATDAVAVEISNPSGAPLSQVQATAAAGAATLSLAATTLTTSGTYTLTATDVTSSGVTPATATTLVTVPPPAAPVQSIALNGSATEAVTFNFVGPAAVASVQVLTDGQTGADFTQASAGGTCSAQTYSAGQSCTVDVAIFPRQVGLRHGAVELLDASGNVLQTVYVSAIAQGPLGTVDVSSPALLTAFDNSTLKLAPNNMVVDDLGDLWVATSSGVYEIPVNQTTGALNPSAAVQLKLSNPVAAAVAVDGAGNVFIADSAVEVVYELPQASVAKAFALPAPAGGWKGLSGLAVDGAGNLFVADSSLGVYKIAPGAAPVKLGGSSITGSIAVATDAAGNIYTTDHTAIYKIPASGGAAALFSPAGAFYSIAADASGSLLALDSSTNALLLVSPQGQERSLLTNLNLAALAPNGDVYVEFGAATATFDLLDRRQTSPPASPTPIAFGASEDNLPHSQTITFGDAGNQSLSLTVNNPSTAGFALTGAAACSSLAPAAICPLTVTFTPAAATAYSDSFTVTGTSSSSPHAFALTGTGVSGPVTQLAFAAPPPLAVSAGANLGTLAIVLEDASGQQVSSSDSVQALVNGAGTPISATATAGIAALNLSSVAFTTPGTVSIQISDATTSGIPPLTFTVSVLAAPVAVNAGAGAVFQTLTFSNLSSPVTSVSVLTEGVAGLDFSEDTAAESSVPAACLNHLNTLVSSCSVAVTFQPKQAGLRRGAVELLNGSAVLATQFIQGTGQAALTTFDAAGGLIPSSANTASLISATADQLVLDGAGDLFLVDGSGDAWEYANSASNFPSTPPSFSTGTELDSSGTDIGLALDGAGNLYLANYLTGVVEVPKQNGAYNLAAKLTIPTPPGASNQVYAVALDGAGTLYAASTDGLFRRGAGAWSPVAAAQIHDSEVVAVDSAGNLYVDNFSDLDSLYKLPAAGGAPVLLASTSTYFNSLSADAAGDLLVNVGNTSLLLISPTGLTTTLLSVSGSDSVLGDAFDPAGNIDFGYHNATANTAYVTALKRSSAPAINFGTVILNTPAAAGEVVSNAGNLNATLTASTLTGSAAFVLGSPASGANCSSNPTLAPAANCSLVFAFVPPSAGADNAQITLSGTSPVSPQTLTLTGVGALGVPSHLSFKPAPASLLSLGGNLGTLTVQVLDAGNNLLAANTDTLQLTLSGGGTASVVATATVASGVATFNLSADALAAAGNYALNVVDQTTSGLPTLTASVSVAASPVVVGQTGAPASGGAQIITFSFSSTTAVASIAIGASGLANEGFSRDPGDTGAASCHADTVYTANQSCTVTVDFTPGSAAGMLAGAVQLLDASGHALQTVFLSRLATGPAVELYTPGLSGAFGGSAWATNVSAQGVAAGAFENIVYADAKSEKVYSYNSFTNVTTPVGSGWVQPQGVALDGAGNVYVADAGLGEVVEVPSDGSAQKVIMNLSSPGQGPWAVATDASGNVYVADTANGKLWRSPAGCSSLFCQSLLASGLGAHLDALASDPAGDLYFPDPDGTQIDELPSGASSVTVLGSGLSSTTGLAVDAAGDVFVLGGGSLSEITSANLQTTWAVKIPVPSGTPGFAIAPSGDMFLPQGSSLLMTSGQFVRNLSTTYGAPSPAATVVLQNIGNATLTINPVGVPAPLVHLPPPSAADCSAGAPLASSATCSLVLEIPATAPVSSGGVGNLTFTTNLGGASGFVFTNPIPASILRAPLSITASSATIILGAPIPAISASYSGFVNSDSQASLATAPACSTTATASSPAGAYPTSCSGAVDSNYSITYVPGVLTINPVPVTTVSLSASSLTFASQPVNTTSAAQTLVLTASGNQPIVLATAAASSGFTATASPACSSIAPGATCSISVVFSPAASGAASGTLTLTDNAGTQTVTLSGTGIATGVVLAPSALAFGSVAVGASASLGVTVTNSGSAAVALSSVAAAAPFAASNTCATIPAGASCALTVTFAPTASGAASGTLTLVTAAGAQTLPLSGVGLAAGVSLAPATLAFPATLVGATSAARTLTLTNTGTAALTGIAVAAQGDFAAVNSCSASLAAGASCSIAVAFAPSLAAAETGTLVITDSLGTQPVPLSGTGIAPGANLSASTLQFGGQPTGTASAAQTVVLTNSGSAALALTSVTASAGFSQVSACGASLAPSASCNINVSFAPTASGSISGALTIVDAAGTQVVSLSGQGTAPGLALFPSALAFGSQTVGASSAAQTLTLVNSGNAPLTLAAISVTGDYTLATTCSTSVPLPAGSVCFLNVTFAPSATGDRTGSVSISAPGGLSASAALDGSGADAGIAAAPAVLAFGSQTLGAAAAPQTVTVANTGVNSLTISAVSTTGAFAQTNTCSQPLAPGASCVVSVTMVPAQAGSFTGTLDLDNSADGLHTVALSGSATAAGATLLPAQLAFGSQPIPGPNTTLAGAPQTLTLANTGSAALTINSIAITGPFSYTSTCAASLPASSSCTLSVTFAPQLTGNNTGLLTISDSVGTHVAALDGFGSPNGLTLAPPVLDFGGVSSGQTSTSQSVTLTNDTGHAISGLTISASGEFGLSTPAANACGSSLATAASCVIQVTFTPASTGGVTGSVSISGTLSATASPGPRVHQLAQTPAAVQLAAIALQGSGTSPTLTAAPATLSFAAEPVGTAGPSQPVTVTNSGATALSGLTVSASPDFTLTNQCSATLAPSASCTVSVAFDPTAPGQRTGTLQVSASGGLTAQVALTGAAGAPTNPVSLSASSLSFAVQGVGVASAAQSVTLTNNQSTALAITGVAISGSNAADFAQTNTCGSSLASGSSCTASVTFKPAAAGPRSATLVFTDSAGSQSVSLAGSGSDFTLSAGAAATITAGQTASIPLTLTGLASDNQTVALTCAVTGTGTACTASPASVSLTGTTPATATISVTTTAQTAAFPALPLGGSGPFPWPLALLALALAAALLAWQRRRWKLILAGAALLALASCGGGGGGGGGNNPPPPATLTVTVTATSSTGVAHTASVNVTVNP